MKSIGNWPAAIRVKLEGINMEKLTIKSIGATLITIVCYSLYVYVTGNINDFALNQVK
jgi:hypothetical protein